MPPPRFSVGDRVIIRFPETPERAGVVVETDTHPLEGDTCKVRILDLPAGPREVWFFARWLFPSPETHDA